MKVVSRRALVSSLVGVARWVGFLPKAMKSSLRLLDNSMLNVFVFNNLIVFSKL